MAQDEVFSFTSDELYSLHTRKEMLQSHEASSFMGFLPRSGGFSPTITGSESFMIMEETEWGEQPRTQFLPESHEDLSLSIGARFQQPFAQRMLCSGSEVQNMFQGAVSFDTNVKSSKYLNPSKELLHEFCNLAEAGRRVSTQGALLKKWEKAGGSSSSSSSSSAIRISLQTLDILQLQRRKANLLSLLEEVNRRYKRYCECMRAVVWTLEAAAGGGAAKPYLALSSKTMSRHFRRLRDGIVEQIQEIKKAMGEKDPITPGVSRGKTPRLKLIDQCLRQHKAFVRGGVFMDLHPWRPQRGLPECSVSVLRAWLFEHFLHPYPSYIDKHILAKQTRLSKSQVTNWFINARVRLWKPMIEEMYKEEINKRDGKPAEGMNPNPLQEVDQEQKKRMVINEPLSEPGYLSSIVNEGQRSKENGFFSFNRYSRSDENFSGSGVNLTLGLQHDEGGGMGFSFQNQQHVFFSREQMEQCHVVKLGILEGEVHDLQYKNLMGTELLHDIAG